MAVTLSGEQLAGPDEPEAGAPPPRYLDRELSWLDFNARVLALAEDPDVPLLERVKFTAIFSRNLDEFFMIRVAGLTDRAAAGLGAAATEGLTPAEELQSIRDRTVHLLARQMSLFRHELCPSLAAAGIELCDWDKVDQPGRRELSRFFDEQIFPVLTPLSVDPGHPFPYISNLSLSLAVQVRDPERGETRFARVKVPPLLPRFVLTTAGRYIPLEQVIAAHLPALFPGMEILNSAPFRVTRNADLMVTEGEADDLISAVEMELRRRRFGHAVRLEIDAAMSDEVRDILTRELDLDPDEVYVVDGPLDLESLWALHKLDRPDLKDPPWSPVTPPRLVGVEEGSDIFAVLREGGELVHHPYDSFADSVQAFIRQAAVDPDVLAIKQTLYRTSGDSPIVKALIRAAEHGKQVAVLIELTARFDEEANIAWARKMEEAGVHVVYGLVGFKTHSKTALVVRAEPDGIRRYCHIGSGNYNSTTARLYEDVGLLSADPDLGADLGDLFNFITGYSRRGEYRKIEVAPHGLRDRIITLIEEAAAEEGGGRIVMKMNSLVDEAVIEALYTASAAGCQIDLIVRGICRLRPETPGLSENIRVRSILGRYLEHSRIFAFGTGRHEPVRYMFGSADMMPRNLDRRIEVMTPVDEPALTARLQEILDVNLADTTQAWQLGADGSWVRCSGGGEGTHTRLQALALERAAAGATAPVAAES
ncbi:MAG: RNA degradosome polyphosphate kinase [Actinomycetota bacterium]|nr:RNA degradosome polyphosphate kinase [Actinomycetota bacterium]